MAKEIFIDKKFKAASLDRLELANSILTEYEAQGYDLTLRQLYYQMVARGHIPNNLRSYKNLGNLINDGRLAGLIDWDMIVDTNRQTVVNPHWSSPASIVRSAARSFKIDKWEDQGCHIEIIVEKDALSRIFKPVCSKLDVRFTAAKGYPSASILYQMSKRLIDKARQGKEIWILHFGDHDPSGIDMTRDLADRLELFLMGYNMEVDRLALNMSQIEELRPPENPAKTTDSRHGAYIRRFGHASWELDAIEPTELEQIVEDAVVELRDDNLWDAAVARELKMRSELMEFANNYGSKK